MLPLLLEETKGNPELREGKKRGAVGGGDTRVGRREDNWEDSGRGETQGTLAWHTVQHSMWKLWPGIEQRQDATLGLALLEREQGSVFKILTTCPCPGLGSYKPTGGVEWLMAPEALLS